MSVEEGLGWCSFHVESQGLTCCHEVDNTVDDENARQPGGQDDISDPTGSYWAPT